MLKKIFLLLTLLAYIPQNVAVTLVYNIKIRRAFDVPASLQIVKKPIVFSVVPIVYTRSSRIIDAAIKLDTCEKRNVCGALFNVRYLPTRNWWVEVTTGIEKDAAEFVGTDSFKRSRNGFDDIVLSGGYRGFIGERIQLVGYGLMGFPVRSKVDLFDRYGPLVGTRVYNLGGGVEASYALLKTEQRSCSAIAQARFIHGFNRSWFPILPQGAQIQPGNFTDLFFSLQYREATTIFELGYDATIFSQQAVILLAQKIPAATFVRNSGYASITHGMLKGWFNKPWIFGVGVNFSRSKKFDAKTLSGWLSCSVVF